jgi:hypothetical protein
MLELGESVHATLTLFLTLTGCGIGIVPPSLEHVNQEFPCAIKCFAAPDNAMSPIPATCFPTLLGLLNSGRDQRR